MPTIYVIAGPNGIGKTTSASDILKGHIPIINSDKIAKKAKALGIISVNSRNTLIRRPAGWSMNI